MFIFKYFNIFIYIMYNTICNSINYLMDFLDNLFTHVDENGKKHLIYLNGKIIFDDDDDE